MRFLTILLPILLPILLTACNAPNPPRLGDGKPGLNVALAALAGGSPDLALNVSNSVLSSDAGNVPALVIKGDSLTALGHPEDASASYAQALAADPADIGAQVGLGRLRLRSDPAQAQVLFLSVLQREPRNAVALNNLGISYDLQGDHASAQAAYRRALGVEPMRHATAVNLALSMALSGQASEAVPLLRPLAADAGATRRDRHDLAAALAISGDRVAASQILRADLSPEQVQAALRAYTAFGK